MRPEDHVNSKFSEKVLRYQEKSLSAEELKALNQELRESPELRLEFTRICETSRLIQEASQVKPMIRHNGWIKYAAIAAILIICLGFLVLQRNTPSDDHWGDAVAEVEMITDDASIDIVDGVVIEKGTLLGKGWVRIKKGAMRLKFRSGAVLTLKAPAALGIDSAMRSYLEFGKVEVYAPDSAREFVVATNTMEVVDLGTRFGLQVDLDSGESVVEVTEGLVDLHLGSRGTQRQIQPLEAGWKAEVNGAGQIVNLEERPEAVGIGQETLVARWGLDEMSNAGQVLDSGDAVMDGIYRGDASGTIVPGRVGGALEFGSEGYLDLSAHLPAIAKLDSFTFAAWIRDPKKGVGILFSISDGTARNRVQFSLNNKNLVYLWQNESAHWDSLAGQVEGWHPDQWYHVAVSVSSSGVRIYRDGELLTSGSTGIQIGTPALRLSDIRDPKDVFLGRVREGTGGTLLLPQWFGGVMDEAQLYSGALDHAEIRFLHGNPGKALPIASEKR